MMANLDCNGRGGQMEGEEQQSALSSQVGN